MHFSFHKLLFLTLLIAATGAGVSAQSHAQLKRVKASSICGNPQVRCNTSVEFQPYDLPFRVPKNSVIFDTELFYAVILKSVAAGDNDCDTFVPEPERLAAQALFPDRKVFTSRCVEAPYLFYTNISDKHRIMAVYAGATVADSKRALAAVKLTGKFPDAYLRRMRTGFNGT
ncbi:MAG TPA: hypothetical protein VIW64_04120 [Pyrinomonadaceae bacterium]|jgi:hypothetical protein